MRTFLACLLVAAIGCGGSASAGDGHDADRGQDRARRAVQQGAMLPLREIIARAQADWGGEVVEAELEDERGVPVYEVKVLTRTGRLVKARYDARTGAPLAGGEGKKR
jgi:uncharacterized membrane protein YkoI